MFKFAVVFVCLACASTTPLDSKVEGSTENGKKNVTEKANDEKSVPPYTVGDYYYQKPVFYPMPTGNKPIFSNPMVRQPTSWPAYQFLNAKTFLRPQMYQGQSQLYSYPYQSSIQPYSYGSSVQSYPVQSYQSYPQSAYAYSYQPSMQSYYGSYKQAKEQEPVPMHSTPARIFVEKPVGQPVDQVPMASPMGVPMASSMGVPMAMPTMPMGIPAGPDQQVSNVIPRDASTNWIPYTVLPQDNSGPMDNMPIQPSYLMDHQQLQSPSARSVEDFSSPEYGPSGSGDEVYYVMNKYDQQPLVAKATDEVFPSNSMWMAPVSAPVPAFRDNKPYSPEVIFGNMAQFLASKYQEQLSMANQNLPRTAKSSYSNTDKLVEKLLDELSKKADAKKTEGPVKAEEKKETSTAPPKANA